MSEPPCYASRSLSFWKRGDASRSLALLLTWVEQIYPALDSHQYVPGCPPPSSSRLIYIFRFYGRPAYSSLLHHRISVCPLVSVAR